MFIVKLLGVEHFLIAGGLSTLLRLKKLQIPAKIVTMNKQTKGDKVFC